MKLLISDTIEPRDADEFRLTFNEFKDKTYHPFIATNSWELITIEVNDDTPKGYIKQLIPIATIAVVLTNPVVSVHQVQVLSEIFPDYAGTFKKLFVTDTDKLLELINSLSRKV